MEISSDKKITKESKPFIDKQIIMSTLLPDEFAFEKVNCIKLYKNQNINNDHIIPKIQECHHNLKDGVDDIVMKIDKLFFARTWDVEPKWVEIESIHEKVLSNISLFEEV